MKRCGRNRFLFAVPLAVGLFVSVSGAETWDANVNLPPVEKARPQKAAVKTEAKPVPDELKRAGKPVDDRPQGENFFKASQSSPDSIFWVGGGLGFTTNSTGIGGQTSVNLKLKFGRCAAIGQWHTENVYIYDPADIHNSIFGLGAQCTILQFPQHWGFFGGTHVTATAMVENGTSTIHLYELTGQWGQGRREVRAQRLNSWGGSAGGDIYVPLLFGFWANYSLGLEQMFFDYDLSGVSGTRTDIPQI